MQYFNYHKEIASFILRIPLGAQDLQFKTLIPLFYTLRLGHPDVHMENMGSIRRGEPLGAQKT